METLKTVKLTNNSACTKTSKTSKSISLQNAEVWNKMEEEERETHWTAGQASASDSKLLLLCVSIKTTMTMFNQQSITDQQYAHNAFGRLIELCLKTLQDAIVKMWSTTVILIWRQSIIHSGTDSTPICRQSVRAEAGHTFCTGVRGWRLAGQCDSVAADLPQGMCSDFPWEISQLGHCIEIRIQ